MNKKLSFVGIILALLLLTVNSAFAAGVVDVTSVTSQSGFPADSKIFTITVNNTGDAIISTVNFISSDLVLDATNKILGSSLSIPAVTNLVVGVPQTTTFTLTIPSKLYGVYNANPGITATDASTPTNTDSLTYSLTINQKDLLDVLTYDNTTALEIIGEEGQSNLVGTFQIKNTGSTNLDLAPADFDTSATGFDLSDSDNDAITLTFSDPASLSPGSTATVTITANFGQNIDLDTYGGTVNVKKSGVTLDLFKLDLKVHPEICEDGIVKDGDASSRATANLELNVKEPDNGDDFKSGDQITVEVEVQNEDEDNMDVTVEAILYNLDEDEEVATAESSSEEINDNSKETFEFDLDVPRNFDGDKDDRYVMFVKAIEDGDEDQNCNFDSINMDFKRENDDVIVRSADLTASVVKPGDVVELIVDAENVGSNDQRDAYIKVTNSELGISLTSAEFDLDKAGDSNDDITRRFTLNIPANAAEKDYLIDISVYDDNDDSYDNSQEFVTLTVKSTGATTGTGTTGTGKQANLNVATQTKEFDAAKGSASLHLQFTNNEGRDINAAIDITTIGDWADPISSQTVSLHPGDNNLYFNLKLKDIDEGTYTATVTVRPAAANEFDAKSFSLNFDVKEKAGLGGVTGAFAGTSSTVFWIIGDIVLIIVALFFIKSIFFGKK